MRTPTFIACSTVLTFLALSALAQPNRTHTAKPGPNRPPQPLAPEPNAMGRGIGAGIGAQGGLDLPPLKARSLENHPLDDKEQKKYDSLVTSAEKRTAPAGRTANPATQLAADFQLGAKQLSFGQEQDAEDTFKKAWEAIPALLKDPRSIAIAAGQVRVHQRVLSMLVPKDPSLVLTIMTDLGEQHDAALKAIDNPKQKPQLAGPVASTWFELMQAGQLEPKEAEKAATWIMLMPEMAIANRPLTPDQQSMYREQLTQATINANNKLVELARREMGMVGPAANSAEAGAVDPAVMAIIEGKSAAISRFLEADVHFRWGQFRQGLEASETGWKELLVFYRSNPRGISPLDSELHFQSLARMSAKDPVQAFVLLNDLDAAYRGITQVDRSFGGPVADQWNRMATALPLNAAMLERAISWIEYVSKQGKEQQGKYGSSLTELKSKLEEARKAEGLEQKDQKEEMPADQKDRKTDRQPKQEPDQNDTKAKPKPKHVGPRGVNLPKQIDPTRQ